MLKLELNLCEEFIIKCIIKGHNYSSPSDAAVGPVIDFSSILESVEVSLRLGTGTVDVAHPVGDGLVNRINYQVANVGSADLEGNSRYLRIAVFI